MKSHMSSVSVKTHAPKNMAVNENGAFFKQISIFQQGTEDRGFSQIKKILY